MKIIYKIYVLGILLSITSYAKAQSPKFGHIDFQALVQIMPERASADKQVLALQKELEDALGIMQKEFQTKYVEYASKKDSLSETVRKMKEEDLQTLNEKIQSYQQNAQQQLQNKNAELYKPIIDKANNAIKDVGTEKGLIYIFDMSLRVILYNSKESLDILPFVKTKLGIQ